MSDHHDTVMSQFLRKYMNDTIQGICGKYQGKACTLLHIILQWCHIDELVQERLNSRALAMELHLSCTDDIYELRASHITRNSTVCWKACSSWQQRNHQRSALLALCEGNHSIQKRPVMQKAFPCHDIIIICSHVYAVHGHFVKLGD